VGSNPTPAAGCRRFPRICAQQAERFDDRCRRGEGPAKGDTARRSLSMPPSNDRTHDRAGRLRSLDSRRGGARRSCRSQPGQSLSEHRSSHRRYIDAQAARPWATRVSALAGSRSAWSCFGSCWPRSRSSPRFEPTTGRALVRSLKRMTTALPLSAFTDVNGLGGVTPTSRCWRGCRRRWRGRGLFPWRLSREEVVSSFQIVLAHKDFPGAAEPTSARGSDFCCPFTTADAVGA
jgi:hypothetical protein